jgi:hypothetical protein
MVYLYLHTTTAKRNVQIFIISLNMTILLGWRTFNGACPNPHVTTDHTVGSCARVVQFSRDANAIQLPSVSAFLCHLYVTCIKYH